MFGQLFAGQQFGSAGTPGIEPLRTDSWDRNDGGATYSGGGGYNVVTWDPRGEYRSGGQLQIDNPMFEGRDVSSIISWLSSSTNPYASQVEMDPQNTANPLVGMTGGSYGGGIQLTTVDPRIKAIIPEIGWNSLLSSLYPNSNQFLTGFGTILAAALFFTGARINPVIYEGIATGVLTGFLTKSQQAVLGSVGPTTLLTQEKAATLLFQGEQDVLFPLAQGVTNVQTIASNPYDTPVKMVWFCGGHGNCNTMNSTQEAYQDDLGVVQNLQWLDSYVAGYVSDPAQQVPNFQWYDQQGKYFSSALQPFQAGFDTNTPITVTGSGGLLGIVPVLGGSGPAKQAEPFSIADAAKARNALNTNVTIPIGEQVVGAPTITFDYSGLGTSRTVYAQLVDDATGQVLANNSTPIPVKLDGRQHSVTIPMQDIAFTSYAADDSLTLQITSSAINYENFTSFGAIKISNIGLSLPVRA